MKIILRENNKYLLRLNRGEEVITELIKFCQENKITAGIVTGLGAGQTATLSFYHLDQKKYEEKEIRTGFEIAVFSGNIATLNNGITLHAHGVLSAENGETTGGHIKKLVIAATGEFVIETMNQPLIRKYNDEIGLNLLATADDR